MSKELTKEELDRQLEEARSRLAETDAAINAAGSDIDEQVLSDLEQRFADDEAEVKRVRAAIDRRERMDNALQAVPRPEKSEEQRGVVQITKEPLIYRSAAEGGQYSFFMDVYYAQKGDAGAMSRLQRHQREMAVERRDLSSTAGAGGEFLPPLHLQSEWAALARAGRPFANAIGSRTMPATGMSFTIPKVTGGTSTATKSENLAVSETDATTSEVTLNVRTIAGQTDLSREAFERSEPGLDEVLFADLVADYAVRLDTQILNGNGTAPNLQGVFNDADINTVTFSDTDPTVPELYPKVADAINQIHTNRFMAPDAIFMHPRRWAWILAALDTSNRPLVTPYAPQNALARFDAVAPENVVGNLQGLTVFVDPNIPTNLGAGTDEDAILVTRLADNILFESDPRTRVFESVGSNTLTIRLQVFGYVAYTSARYSKAHTEITGAGLVAPSF